MDLGYQKNDVQQGRGGNMNKKRRMEQNGGRLGDLPPE